MPIVNNSYTIALLHNLTTGRQSFMAKDESYKHIERQIDTYQVNSLDKISSDVSKFQDWLDITTDTDELKILIPEIITSLNQKWHSLGLLGSSVSLFGEVLVPEETDEENNAIILNKMTIDEEIGISKGFRVFNLPDYFEGERFERQQIVHVLLTEPQYSINLAEESEVSYHLYGIPKNIVIFDDKPDIDYLSQAIPEILEDIDTVLLNPGSKKEKFRELSRIRFEELEDQGHEAYEHLASYINSILDFKIGMPYEIKRSELIFDVQETSENEDTGHNEGDSNETYEKLVPELAKDKLYAYIGGIAIIHDFSFEENTITGLSGKRLALNSLIITRQGLKPAIIPLTDGIIVKPLV